ncbi:hypothetical protein MUN82_03975 [Hymenobacter aerilatus]|uniref:Uncharacterized protein n=1 Tax=Hymenobacter aerilatus TaxID=2932251 RepID=A0A8T9SWZ7_9BACT|nr:hypothetical protein [Hymenobacter aerilatus]UOR06257.1 hypothetical protein MUN82_03975 [Hymenobacter aerilatus]
MTEAVRAQLIAAGALPSGGKGKRPPAAPSAARSQKTDTQQPPALRPAYRVVAWPDSNAYRFVCHGISEAQVAILRQACQAAGIPQQL